MKKNNYIIILLSVLIFISVTYLISNNYENFQTATNYDIIIIAGQSNACGAGTRNTGTSIRGPIYNAANDAPNPRIKQLSKTNTIIEARDPLDHSQDRTGYRPSVGFGMSFAKEYIRNERLTGERNILIIGCGWGGSSMFNSEYYWKKPTAGNNLSKSLHNITISRVNAAKPLIGRTSKIVAFLWHQGESDSSYIATNTTNYNLYKAALKETLTSMRSEIMRFYNQTYQFPILLGGLTPDTWINRITHARFPAANSDTMTFLIQKVSNPSDPDYIIKSSFVPSFSIPPPTGTYNFNYRLQSDNELDSKGVNIPGKEGSGVSHFSATSMRHFGIRYFYYYNLIK
jgi:hypothetical protein